MARKRTLPCPLCHGDEPTMNAFEMFRFHFALRLVGALLCLPALAVTVVGGMMLWGAFSGGANAAGVGAAAVASGLGLLSALPAVLGGLLLLAVGLLLNDTRKVYRCDHCGYIVDRN